MSSSDRTGQQSTPRSSDSEHVLVEVSTADSEVNPSLPVKGPEADPENKSAATASNMAAPPDKHNANGQVEDLINLAEEQLILATEVVNNGTLTETGPNSKATELAAPVPLDAMESSVATLKPISAATPTIATQYLTIDAKTYVDPTPPTPEASQPPSRTPSHARRSSNSTSPARSDGAYDIDRRYMSEDEQDHGGSNSRSEIQSIMEQFTGDGGGPGADEVMSPRLEIAGPMLGTPQQHPPRKSSLEPLAPGITSHIEDLKLAASTPPSAGKAKEVAVNNDSRPPVPPKDITIPEASASRDILGEQVLSPTMSMHRPPPPEPDEEPALPFDFHRFLEQLRNKKADPVARYLKSFLSEFGKRQWMVHEQVKIISDFLAFIANKMAQCDVWREVSDAEFDNAREGMEKLVMNRLYSQTFSPAIPPPQPIPGSKPNRKRGGERPMGPGRRGQHQEDVERDDILAQKIKIYGWVREEHLDIPMIAESGRRFLKLAQQELLKISTYRAPRDKIICVLNCCKVIFGLLKHSKSDSSADSFMPLLIYVVLQANPDHLVSNVQYILRFRNQEKLGGEAGYYLSSLMGAVQFIENMDRTTLTITDDEFERNVEKAVMEIAEKHPPQSPPPPPSHSEKPQNQFSHLNNQHNNAGESSSARRPSIDIISNSDRLGTPRRSTDGGESSDNEKEAAISGLLRSIQRPLSHIGRMFTEEPTPVQGPSRSNPVHTPLPRQSEEQQQQQQKVRQHLSAEEAAARQASAEVAEAQRLHRAEHTNVVETLAGMFPDLDRDIISDVVYQKEGRVGLAVDACLALSS